MNDSSIQHPRYYICLLLLALLTSCQLKQEQTSTTAKALTLIQKLGSNHLHALKEWDLTIRMNHYYTWSKVQSGKPYRYAVLYEPLQHDTIHVEIYNTPAFLEAFPITLSSIDTSETLSLTLYKDSIVGLSYLTSASEDKSLLATPLPVQKVFPNGHPFDELSKLNKLKSDFNFSYSQSYPDEGYIQFTYAPSDSVLIYAPSNTGISNAGVQQRITKAKPVAPGWFVLPPTP